MAKQDIEILNINFKINKSYILTNTTFVVKDATGKPVKDHGVVRTDTARMHGETVKSTPVYTVKCSDGVIRSLLEHEFVKRCGKKQYRRAMREYKQSLKEE